MLKFIVMSDQHILPAGKLDYGLDTLERLDRAVAPVDPDPAEREVHPRVGDAGNRLEALLDARDAAGTVDAVDREIDMAGAVVVRGHVMGKVDGAHRYFTVMRFRDR